MALLPLAFGAWRMQRADDTRLFWMALAATAVALLFDRGATTEAATAQAARHAAFVLAAATLAAVGAASVLGATATPGIWAVALAFGCCFAARVLLHARSRPAGTQPP